MQLALESRTDMLEMVQPFADFDWILAGEVLKDEKHAEFYKSSTKAKFVDNSVNEEGEPISIENLKKAFEMVGGTYIVAPDWIGDADRTIESYKKCLEVFPKDTVIGVIQGPSFSDAMRCISEYKGVLAVPYDICCKKTDPPWLMALKRALVVSNIPTDRYVHLLGFNSLDEFFWYEGRPHITSIDTGAPVLLGLQELDIMDPLESKAKPTYNQMLKLELTQTGWTAICRNIALLRRYLP